MATSMFVVSIGMVPSGTGTTTGLITTSIPIIRASSQLSLFLLYFLIEEFCLMVCPNQPPSIRPISSIFSDIAKYFLLSIDLVSQRIRSSSFNVSIFLIATLMYKAFSSLFTYKALEVISIISIKILSILRPRLKRYSFGKDLK